MTGAVAQIQRCLADIWDEAPVDKAYESRLLDALRKLDDPSLGLDEVMRAEAELMEVLAQDQDIWQKFERRLADLLTGEDRANLHDVEVDRCLRIPVLFATNRSLDKTDGGGSPQYNAKRADQVSWGIAEVSVPDAHRIGRLEKPRRWRLEFRRRTDRHVVLVQTEHAVPEEALSRCAWETGRQHCLFVHGYNTSFHQAIKRAGQLALDLSVSGTMAVFSWPSASRKDPLTAYNADFANADWAKQDLADVLRALISTQSERSLDVLAHSMGNHPVVQALQNLALSEAFDYPFLKNLVLAAPDVDTGSLVRTLERVPQLAQRGTLYLNSGDRALAASALLAGHERAGQGDIDLAGVPWFDVIDASVFSGDLLSHSYYGSEPAVLGDLFSIFRHDHGPTERFGLRRVGAGQRWEFVRQSS